MIRMDIVGIDNFTVSGNEPFRVDFDATSGTPIVHVYAGQQPDEKDEPIGLYDGTLDNRETGKCGNKSWRSLNTRT